MADNKKHPARAGAKVAGVAGSKVSTTGGVVSVDRRAARNERNFMAKLATEQEADNECRILAAIAEAMGAPVPPAAQTVAAPAPKAKQPPEPAPAVCEATTAGAAAFHYGV